MPLLSFDLSFPCILFVLNVENFSSSFLGAVVCLERSDNESNERTNLVWGEVHVTVVI